MSQIFNEEYVFKFKNQNIIVSPAVECLGVIFVLGDFKLNIIRCNEQYRNIIKEFFVDFKQYKIIEICNNFFDGRYDAPVELFIHLQNGIMPSKPLLQRLNMSLEDYELLVTELKKFILESNFNEFFEKNKAYYKISINRYVDRIKEFSPDEYLFEFLGLKSDNLNILCMFGVTTSNYGINVNNKLYCCIRPYFKSNFTNDLDFAYDLVYSSTLILHEYAHSFINPLTDKHLKNEDINYKKCKPALDKNPYGTHLKTVVNETIIRALECLYVKKNFTNGYEELKQDYINDGFVCIDETIKSLENYDKKRCKYKDIEDYYEELIKIFK